MKKLLLLLLVAGFAFSCATTEDAVEDAATDAAVDAAVEVVEEVVEERVMTPKTQVEVYNGDFAAGIDEWELGTGSAGGEATLEVVDEVMVINIASAGRELWSVGLYSMEIPVERKDIIRVTFDAKADADTRIGCLMGMDRQPYTTYGHSGDIRLVGGADWETYTFELTAVKDDIHAQLAYEFGKSTATTIYIDNVVVEKIGTAE